jgi:outer membrane protein OmpA-like peptidoglycan-associated protein
MKRPFSNALFAAAAALLGALPALAADAQLAAVQYPEGSSVTVKFAASNRVAPAEAEASVKFKSGQARIEIEYKNLPPAILFGGDVTSYVVWAVARDGKAENVGELAVRDPKGDGEFRSTLKEFGLLVTAETYPLVATPSDLVCFTSLAPPVKKARSTMVTVSGLAPAAAHGNEQIGGMRYSGTEPLQIVQAQAVLNLARHMGAEQYSADTVRDAGITLAQATNSFNAGKKKQGIDFAARSLTLSSTALRDTERRLAEKAAAEAAARRAAEMQALEQGKQQAQQQAAAAEQQALAAREQALAAREQALQAQQQLSALQQQAQQAQQEAAAAEQRAAAAGLTAEAAEAARRDADEARKRAETLTAQVAAQAAVLESEKASLQAENERLMRERNDLAAKLTNALSTVAQITTTARGVVVNLPDILFDINKATLKPDAQVALAKLAGIVSLFPNINLRIEGYTDSTGGDELNDRLSRDRAASVKSFLVSQGIAADRMTTEGYGKRYPIADNSTAQGRAKNRRVEIILAEGVIQGAGN